MLFNNDIVLLGYSGHGLVVAESALAAGMQLKFYAEKNQSLSNPFNLNYLGFEGSDDFNGWKNEFGFIIGVGDNMIRHKIASIVTGKKEKLITVIHPSASIADTVSTGNGVFIARNVSVSPLAIISDYTILNTGCIVEHECTIGTAVHIGPGAVLNGNVSVGTFGFIGANAVIKQGISIGDNAVVGMGAVVVKNVPANEVWVGNPAKRIR